MYKLLSKIFDRLDRGLSPRDKGILVSLLLLISVLSIILAVKYYNYIQKDQEFCNSCHLMGEAYTAWKLSAHSNIVCQDCHRLSLLDQNRLLIKFVFTTDRKTPEPHGAETPWKTCMKCHWDEAAQGGVAVNRSTGHARHVFMEKLVCQDCHKRTVHSFRPDDGACGRCHEGREVHGMGGKQLSCLLCHPFMAKKQEATLLNRDRCLSCHRKLQSGIFPNKAPMTRLSCFECHKPHARNKLADQDCSRCHTGEVLMLKPAHKSLNKHCTTCHIPHRWTAR